VSFTLEDRTIRFKTIKEDGQDYVSLNEVLQSLKIKANYNRALHKLSFYYRAHTVILSPVSDAIVVDGKIIFYKRPVIIKTGTSYISGRSLVMSLAPILGYKLIRQDIIVLDAGHGGTEDDGAKVAGADKTIVESGIVLGFTNVLKARLEALGYKVLLTRDSDTATALKDRIAKANDSKARIFVSIHANSAPNKEAKGIEIFCLSEKASDRHAELVAAAENKVFKNEMGSDTGIENIIRSMILDERIRESEKLASYVSKNIPQEESRSIKNAPFYVLAGTSMPSILLEIGFLTNEQDLLKILSQQWLNNLADNLADGIKAYLQTLNRSEFYEG
jgi:N-acetylmuramoyl-L-alanine amidase